MIQIFKDENELQNKVFSFFDNYKLKTFSIGFINRNKDTEIKQKQTDLVKEVEQKYNLKIDYGDPDGYIAIDPEINKIELNIKSVFIAGRYNKYSRELPQTYYFCYKCKGRGCSFCNRTGKLSNISIEEILGPYFSSFCNGKEIKFHGAGREDMDVKMLGRGRPFVIQIVEPQKRFFLKEELKKLKEEINLKETKVKVHYLKIINKKEMGKITSEQHKKEYSALVSCEKEITQKELDNLVGDYNVLQRTPERVSKRRVDLDRAKTATIKVPKMLTKNEFKVRIESSAGLYIKEFISGDGERTKPSVSDLLKKKCTCKELDVLRII